MSSFHPNINLTVEMNLDTNHILDVKGVIKMFIARKMNYQYYEYSKLQSDNNVTKLKKINMARKIPTNLS